MEITTDRRRGAIGVDLNADHLAVAETDASGNYVKAWRVPLVTYGPPSGGGVDRGRSMEYARGAGKPLVVASWTAEESGAGGRVPQVLPDAVRFRYGKVKAYFISRGFGKELKS